MKKIVFVAAFTFVFSMAVSAYATDMPKPIHKLSSGLVEILKSPIVLVDHTKMEVDGAKYKPFGLLKGLVTSPFYMVKKAGFGVIDVATFPIE